MHKFLPSVLLCASWIVGVVDASICRLLMCIQVIVLLAMLRFTLQARFLLLIAEVVHYECYVPAPIMPVY